MTEEFLHYLWKFRLIDPKDLRTAEGELLQIVHPGHHNHNAGPDFSNARIQIGQQLWAGNLEIHVQSSDWLKHGHQNDEAYDNVILHVVYEHDKDLPDKSGNKLPVLELKGRFDEYRYWKYEQLVQTKDIIPCAGQLPAVDNMVKESMLERVLVERLEAKAALVLELWQQNNKDWNETFYQWMARGFGLKVNAEPMLMLARNLPQSILARHKDNLFQLEALLFGVSGLLNESEDDYARELTREWKHLSQRHGLEALEASMWKYSRLRPPSFPDVRIGQFAALIHRSENLFSRVLGTGSLQVLKQLLSDSPSVYWREHYRLGVPHKRTKAGMGEAFQQILIINVVVPFLFIYGKLKDESFYRQRALDLLDQLPAEDNKIIRNFKSLKISVNSAFASQAVLQLNNEYCSLKKCLNCSIGIHLLKK